MVLSESLVILVSWPVCIVLIIIFLVCLFVEFAFPGTGIFAAGSMAALLVLLGAPWIVGLAQWWDILFVLLGITLVAVELFLLPGTFVAGVTGALLMLAGLVGTFVSGTCTWRTGRRPVPRHPDRDHRTGGAIAIMWWLGRRFEDSRFASRFVLRTEGKALDVGSPVATADRPAIGTAGMATTDLRPAGRIRCGDSGVDAGSSGRWIRKGAAVRIVRNDMIIEVEEIDQ